MRDNGLKVLDDGVILKSQAQLAASLNADWDENTRKACETLLAKLDNANPLYATVSHASFCLGQARRIPDVGIGDMFLLPAHCSFNPRAAGGMVIENDLFPFPGSSLR